MYKKEEFIQVIKENEGIIFKITKVYAAHQEDQKDLYQEIVYQLWKSMDRFKGDSKISTWIYRIALNTSIAHLNHQKKSANRVSIDGLPLHLADEQDSALEEKVRLLYAQIKELNEIEKGIILLFLEGKNYDEIASITGFTSTNVSTRLSRIKRKLKSQIN